MNFPQELSNYLNPLVQDYSKYGNSQNQDYFQYGAPQARDDSQFSRPQEQEYSLYDGHQTQDYSQFNVPQKQDYSNFSGTQQHEYSNFPSSRNDPYTQELMAKEKAMKIKKMLKKQRQRAKRKLAAQNGELSTALVSTIPASQSRQKSPFQSSNIEQSQNRQRSPFLSDRISSNSQEILQNSMYPAAFANQSKATEDAIKTALMSYATTQSLPPQSDYISETFSVNRSSDHANILAKYTDQSTYLAPPSSQNWLNEQSSENYYSSRRQTSPSPFAMSFMRSDVTENKFLPALNNFDPDSVSNSVDIRNDGYLSTSKRHFTSRGRFYNYRSSSRRLLQFPRGSSYRGSYNNRFKKQPDVKKPPTTKPGVSTSKPIISQSAKVEGSGNKSVYVPVGMKAKKDAEHVKKTLPHTSNNTQATKTQSENTHADSRKRQFSEHSNNESDVAQYKSKKKRKRKPTGMFAGTTRSAEDFHSFIISRDDIFTFIPRATYDEIYIHIELLIHKECHNMNFIKVKHFAFLCGRIKVVCGDEDSMYWLENEIQQLSQSKKFGELKILKMSEIPQLRQYSMYINSRHLFDNSERLIDELKLRYGLSNNDIFFSKTVLRAKGCAFFFGLSEKGRECLKVDRMCPYFGLQQISINEVSNSLIPGIGLSEDAINPKTVMEHPIKQSSKLKETDQLKDEVSVNSKNDSSKLKETDQLNNEVTVSLKDEIADIKNEDLESRSPEVNSNDLEMQNLLVLDETVDETVTD